MTEVPTGSPQAYSSNNADDTIGCTKLGRKTGMRHTTRRPSYLSSLQYNPLTVSLSHLEPAVQQGFSNSSPAAFRSSRERKGQCEGRL